jgi:hypothetical protein
MIVLGLKPYMLSLKKLFGKMKKTDDLDFLFMGWI